MFFDRCLLVVGFCLVLWPRPWLPATCGPQPGGGADGKPLVWHEGRGFGGAKDLGGLFEVRAI